ncbi:MAG: hypothetical protein H6718_02505 [Polyangiaceae bacterium]|nr:hypothetical protein [Myxococcales bacterium]MCB9584236.1 hypothetical protein [Polyangiaceae bacterium]MCB9608601.1 hypothetical protein [Polyangiaceae bacterium]
MVDLAELKRINAWLQAAAAARTQADEGYVFELFALPAEGTVEDALARYTAGTNWQVSVSDATWSEVEAALGLWFGETAEASEVLSALFASATKVRRLEISAPPGEWLKPWYEASWDDFILASPKGRVLLHLGVSD